MEVKQSFLLALKSLMANKMRALLTMLGIIIGVAEGLLIVWLMYVLNESGLFGQFGEMIATDTSQSQILSLIYEYNYLARIAAGF